MPYTRTYVDDGKGLHKWGVGIVTGAEILASFLPEAENEERCRRLRYKLIDYSATTGTKITSGEMCQIAHMNRKIASLTNEVAVAVVAPADTNYAYGMARIWKTLTEDFGWKSNVFHNRSDALSWLKKQLTSGTDQSQFPSLNSDSAAPPSSCHPS